MMIVVVNHRRNDDDNDPDRGVERIKDMEDSIKYPMPVYTWKEACDRDLRSI